MTSIKMIIAVVGSLIFLGIFSAGFSSADHQAMAQKACSSNVQDVNTISFTCFDQQTAEKK